MSRHVFSPEELAALAGYEMERRRACNKHSYPSKKDALTARNARTTGRREYRHNRPEDLRAYPCAHCRGWHLTHRV